MNCAAITFVASDDVIPEVISREPWPAQSIHRYRSIDDGDWGYLIVYSDGRFYFDDKVHPSRSEILQRWSHYLSDC